jgi:hypothetical protein
VSDSPKLALLALNEIAKLLTKLTEAQLQDLVDGRAVVEFRTADETVTSRPVKKAATRSQPPQPLDLDEALATIKGMTEEDEVERYLIAHDKQLNVDALRKLAEMIGPPVSPKGSKPVLRKNIAAGTAGLVNRPASMFNTGWNR